MLLCATEHPHPTFGLKQVGWGCSVAYKSMWIVLIKVSNVFARYFLHEADNRLCSINLKHDLTVDINYKNNLITHFLAHILNIAGVNEESQENGNKYWLLFKDINLNWAPALSILVINVNFSVTATCVFHLS